MENPFQLFKHPKFGKIRVIIKDGVPLFVGKDAALALGYKDHKNALKQHVDPEDKRLIQRGQIATLEIPNRGLTFINESGLYSLIFGSKLPEAKEFKCWVTNEVLPAIRQTGSYSLDAQTTQLVPAQDVQAVNGQSVNYVQGVDLQAFLLKFCDAMTVAVRDAVNVAVHDVFNTQPVQVEKKSARSTGQLKDARVYILEMNATTVKIGQSSNPRRRTAEIESETKSKSNRIYYTPLMSREDARLIEWTFKKNFSSRKVRGEFFCMTFEETCAELERQIKLLATEKVFRVLLKN